MQGIVDDLRFAVRATKTGRAMELEARYFIDTGERWLDGLGARRHLAAYAEEVRAVTDAVAELRAAVRARWPKVIRLFWVPERVVPGTVALGKLEVAANHLARLDPRTRAGTADPGYIKPRPLVRPSVEVLRMDDGWVDRRGRARVETAYELVIGGQRSLFGSKRYVMRQAQWAVMVDPMTGKLPEIETLTGVARRRALYRRRKDNKRLHLPAGWTSRASKPWHGTPRDYKGRHGNRREKARMVAYLMQPLLPASRWKDPMMPRGIWSTDLAQAEQRRQEAAGEHQPTDLRRLGRGGEGVDQDADYGDDHRDG